MAANFPVARLADFTDRAGKHIVAAFEQPIVVRLAHWISAVTVSILIASGLQIFYAFPSFGPKIPQVNLIQIPQSPNFYSIGGIFRALSLGGWLAGADQWHFTFMWIFIATGIVYVSYEIISGHYKTVLFVPRDIPGVWPMVRHYFLFGKKPPQTAPYNPLQRLAYTSAIFFGAVSMASGLVMFNPVQFSWLGALMGGFHYARIWHFIAMAGFLSFIPGHLLMVAIHGWHNFMGMLTGWKRDPEYLSEYQNQSGK
jgi:thiosulfate reductase cytochrome b subunit